MSNTFFISDTHFGHAKIIEYEKEHRPFSSVEEHDEALIERWNSVVTPKDTVWHLGDVVMRRSALEQVGRLNGTKNLCMGNHDSEMPMERYLEFFSKVLAYGSFDGNLLSHIPCHENQLYNRFKANIHGHLHSKRVMVTKEFDTGIGTFPDLLIDGRYINVSCEQNNLTPISYEDLKKKHEGLQRND